MRIRKNKINESAVSSVVLLERMIPLFCNSLIINKLAVVKTAFFCEKWDILSQMAG